MCFGRSIAVNDKQRNKEKMDMEKRALINDIIAGRHTMKIKAYKRKYTPPPPPRVVERPKRAPVVPISVDEKGPGPLLVRIVCMSSLQELSHEIRKLAENTDDKALSASTNKTKQTGAPICL